MKKPGRQPVRPGRRWLAATPTAGRRRSAGRSKTTPRRNWKFILHKGLGRPDGPRERRHRRDHPEAVPEVDPRTGFGPNLFDEWRYSTRRARQDPATRKPNPDFVLNQPRYAGRQHRAGAQELRLRFVARARALGALDFGFRAIIAPSFADIFFNNCFKNGTVARWCCPSRGGRLFDEVAAFPGYQLTIDLSAR